MQQKVGVSFKKKPKVYSFLSCNLDLQKDDYVIVETALGLGYGKVERIEEEADSLDCDLKKVVRKATSEDNSQYEKILDKERLAISITKELTEKYKLDMTVVNAEYSFDASKVIIDFISDDRVDFRELVKELALKLKTRIELRQIGIRDQAKMVGGIGICGRVCCCSAYLKDFEKVSIKMAKTQGLALNPVKISGSCGRLMCCLAYEDNYYSEVYPLIPKIGKQVKTPDGIGEVVYTNALKQIVSVKIISKDGSFVINDYPLEKIKIEESNNNFSNIESNNLKEKDLNKNQNIEVNKLSEDKKNQNSNDIEFKTLKEKNENTRFKKKFKKFNNKNKKDIANSKDRSITNNDTDKKAFEKTTNEKQKDEKPINHHKKFKHNKKHFS